LTAILVRSIAGKTDLSLPGSENQGIGEVNTSQIKKNLKSVERMAEH
jgi:hypothetical protein